ncbi:MAG: hypothetical protein EPO07_15435 [Verrucomicrobia bacterium]|nr:MAG: hypothetical protein EPO07_15435 [Verrucomicrobiota bacterium]
MLTSQETCMTSLDSSSLKFWQIFSEWGFWLVIVGVVGESVELASKWIIRCRQKPLSKRLNRMLLPVESLFWVMLCVGLAMEFLGSHNAMQIADRENARLNDEAGQARVEAEKANERAARLELARTELEKQILETKTNVTKIDPNKQPISTVSAYLRLKVRIIKPPWVTQTGETLKPTLLLGRSSDAKNNVWAISLECDQPLKYGNSEFTWLFCNFRQNPRAPMWNLRGDTVEKIDEYDSLLVCAEALGEEFELIEEGKITFIFNSLQRTYIIPLQKSVWFSCIKVGVP